MRQIRTAVVLAAAAALSACAAPRPSPTPAGPVHDLLIRGGRIVDGTGSPWYRGDVAISGDRIARVGLLPRAQARDTIDATGLIVAPGFIDMLGHSERSILTDGRAISKITQGITSEITGEVSSVVPVTDEMVEEMSGAARERNRWRDLDGYFDAFLDARPAINLGTFVTVGSVRRAVMGQSDRAPTPEEMEEMRLHVAEAMQQGAIGLSSGLIYAPASFATTAEVADLARVAASYGGGYASHIRSEGAGLIEAIEEAIEIGELANTWVQIHHLKASGRQNWGKMRDAVATIEAARARGLDVTADQYPYPAAGTGLDATVPNWAHAGGRDSLLARLSDPRTRARLRGEMSGEPVTDWAIGTVAGGANGIMISDASADSLERYEGMRLDEVALIRGQEPVDAIIDILIADSAATSAIYFAMDEEDIEHAMRQPWVSVGIDAGARSADPEVVGMPHPRAYGSFPRILCRYVRERGVLTMEDAVRKFTALPAARVGLENRGVVKAGMFADLTLFHPDEVCDRATFEEPVQTSAGIVHVLVNGVPVVRDGHPTDARPGMPLRR